VYVEVVTLKSLISQLDETGPIQIQMSIKEGKQELGKVMVLLIVHDGLFI